jgi:4-coumarate--CoA ligase
VTRGELKSATLALAHGLRRELGKMGGVSLSRGDVVMMVSPNTVAFPAAMMGSIAAGMCISLANPAYTPRELQHQWSDSRAKAVLVHPPLIPGVLKMFELLDFDLQEARRRIILVDWMVSQSGSASSDYVCMSDLVCKGSLQKEEQFAGEEAHTTAILCYSSGTTGKPKGVEVLTRLR